VAAAMNLPAVDEPWTSWCAKSPARPDRPAVQLEVQRQRPHRPAPPHRRTRAARPAASQPGCSRL